MYRLPHGAPRARADTLRPSVTLQPAPARRVERFLELPLPLYW